MPASGPLDRSVFSRPGACRACRYGDAGHIPLGDVAVERCRPPKELAHVVDTRDIPPPNRQLLPCSAVPGRGDLHARGNTAAKLSFGLRREDCEGHVHASVKRKIQIRMNRIQTHKFMHAPIMKSVVLKGVGGPCVDSRDGVHARTDRDKWTRETPGTCGLFLPSKAPRQRYTAFG